MTQHRHPLRGALILAGLTAIWGSTFVVVKDAVAAWPPGLFTAVRFAVATLCFLPFVLRHRRTPGLFPASAVLGFFLFLGYATQTIGLQYTSANRSAFITSLYVIFVPLLSSLLGHRVRPLLWLCATGALLGVGLLSYEGSPPNVGDLWTLGTAATYAVYILYLERYSRRFPALPLTGISLAAVALLSVPWTLAAESHAALPHTPAIWAAVLYLALVATSLTTWLQTIGQSHVTGSQAAVIFTLEPLFATIFAYAAHGETLGLQGWSGAALILTSALLSQLPSADTPDPARA